MQTEIIVAGSGGQGVLFAGMLIAQAAVEENKETTWFPSYGAEMRGGTANSIVIVSDEHIGSPIAARPAALIALNELSLKKFYARMETGTMIIVNSSLIETAEGSWLGSQNLKAVIFNLPATEIADKKIGDVRVANIVAVGTFLKHAGILKLESAKKACAILLAEKPQLIAVNQKALEFGYNYK